MTCSLLYGMKETVYDDHLCYLWQIALNVGLDASLDNRKDCKWIREEAVDVNGTNAYIRSDETSRWILSGSYTDLV
jgi:hypothetical protein